jgi:long-subunit acyl-CoA synthetase (AMP-forming)
LDPSIVSYTLEEFNEQKLAHILFTFFSIDFQTQVSTLICDSKQLKKLPAISSQLQSVRHVIYIEDEPVEDETLKQMNHWAILSFSEVEELGKTSHIDARLLSSSDAAVIMYTSGSTGLPKVTMGLRYGHMEVLMFFIIFIFCMKIDK